MTFHLAHHLFLLFFTQIKLGYLHLEQKKDTPLWLVALTFLLKSGMAKAPGEADLSDGFQLYVPSIEILSQ